MRKITVLILYSISFLIGNAQTKSVNILDGVWLFKSQKVNEVQYPIGDNEIYKIFKGDKFTAVYISNGTVTLLKVEVAYDSNNSFTETVLGKMFPPRKSNKTKIDFQLKDDVMNSKFFFDMDLGTTSKRYDYEEVKRKIMNGVCKCNALFIV